MALDALLSKSFEQIEKEMLSCKDLVNFDISFCGDIRKNFEK